VIEASSSTTLWTRLAEEIASFTRDIRDLPVQGHVRPGEVRDAIRGQYDFRSPVPLEELASDVARLLRRWSVHVTHPRYFGLFNPSVRDAGIAGDLLAALFNPQLAAWSHAPAANEIERHTLHSLASAIGMNPEGIIANFTSGGAEANLSAVLVAIAREFPQSARHGFGRLPARPAIYLTAESHHSFVKIARMTGLGTDALREVRLTERFEMDGGDLARRIDSDRDDGWTPLMIIATAGTTGGGIVDPLVQIARVAAEQRTWLHVDGAWGAAAALSPRLRPAVEGIEHADSLTWDAHKWLSVPMGAGMFFCRHPEVVKEAFATTTSYMPGTAGEESLDPYATTVQWSRRFIGLKVFMSLAEIGIDGYADLIDHQAAMGERLRESLKERGWLVVNTTALPVVCFTHPDIRSGRLTTTDVLETIYARGNVWISEVALGGRERVLRACITSFRTDQTDIACLIEEIEHARRPA
jgi:glutamate/tyrosine decarboxylase-like PLP-dependent enzyme